MSLNKLSQICPSFSPDIWKNTFMIIKDSIYQPSNFFICDFKDSLLKDPKNSVIFLAAEYNFAHYFNVLKKLGTNLVNQINSDQLYFIDFFNKSPGDWITSDLPLTEDVPFFWKELPLKTESFGDFSQEGFEELFVKIVNFSKNKEKVWLFIDNVNFFLNVLEKDLAIGFIQTIFELVKNQSLNACIVVTFDEYSENSDSLKILKLIETFSNISIEVVKPPSGFSKDFDGNVIKFFE